MTYFVLHNLGKYQCSAIIFHPRNTVIYQTHNGIPQNFTSRKRAIELFMAINMYLHINSCPIKRQAHENKTLHMLDKTIDEEPVCMYYGL
jgi:hypothetical protein